MLARDIPSPETDAVDADDVEALADLEAGRVISHQAMRAWILSWGTAEERPSPQVGD